MGTSKLIRKQFVITNFELNHITFIEFVSDRTGIRSVLENVDTEVLVQAILRTNKTTYLRRLLNLMKIFPILTEQNICFEFKNIDKLI